MSSALRQKTFGKTVVQWLTFGLTARLLWACGNAQPAAAPADQAPAAAATTAPAAAPISNTTASAAQPASVRVFTIDQGQSKASFTLNEQLMGSPKTVVGTTPQVTGEIRVDLADLTKTTIGPIQIDARDFTTDSDMRNRALRRFVLQSSRDEFRYIVITPTTVTGLPSTAKAGDTLDLKIAGDLTVSGVTKPVTFATTVKVDADNQLSGVAKTQVLRSDYNLQIPNVPSVANVTDEVQLELQFVANAQ
jgi:polyisoprenoid-binding protein YceI